MKQFSLTIKKAMLFFLFSIIGLMSFAQDSGATSTTTSTNTNKTTTSIFVEPWVWVVGGIVILLILIGLFRKGNSTREIERSTTVIERD